MRKSRFVDPGIGDPKAPIGSESWAQRWRLNLQSITDGADFKAKTVADFVEVGVKHRAWTLITDKRGKTFTDFRNFVEYEKPWGLGQGS